MAEISTIARPYAEAIFAQAQAAGTLEQWSGALNALAAATTTPDLQKVFGDPHLSNAQLFDLIVSAASRDGLFDEAKTLMRMLIDNGRVQALGAVRDQFESLKHAHEGVVDAHVVSAFPLDAAQQTALVTDLEARFKRKVNPQLSIDPALIGGITVTIGDEFVDASVRGKLAAMSAELARI
jgi:F-type H+-transporting ATPase subunit delta